MGGSSVTHVPAAPGARGETFLGENAVERIVVAAIASVPGTVESASRINRLAGRGYPRVDVQMDPFGAAVAVVFDLDDQLAVELSGADGDVPGVSMLGGVGQGFGGHIVGGLLHRGGQPPGRYGDDLGRNRRAFGKHGQGRSQASLGKDHRMDAVGQLPQLGDRNAQL